MAIENDPLICPQEKEQRKRMCLTFSMQNIGSLDKFSKYLFEHLNCFGYQISKR